MTNIPTSTYKVLQQRLEGHTQELQSRIAQLNAARKETFGAQENKLLANDRITTENNCIPRDMTPIGDHFLFGYNVQIGLRSSLDLSDVFAVYRYDPSDHGMHLANLDILSDPGFDEDFHNLYRYYKNTTFAKFHRVGAHLYMVFQVGKQANDIKSFKFVVKENQLEYIGNRFDHEVTFPPEHEFRFTRTNRDMQRREPFSMLSLADRVFVSISGGMLEFRVDDNTEAGQKILEEKVD
ncbi:MAG: DNA repair ATPase, partial [Bacteroidia bacterium]